MKKTISRVLASIMGGLVVTLALCFAISLYQVFTTPDDESTSRSSLFGIVTLESTVLDDGGIGLEIGIGSSWNFVWLWLAIAVFIFLCIITYTQLVNYKKELLAKQNTNSGSIDNISTNSNCSTTTSQLAVTQNHQTTNQQHS